MRPIHERARGARAGGEGDAAGGATRRRGGGDATRGDAARAAAGAGDITRREDRRGDAPGGVAAAPLARPVRSPIVERGCAFEICAHARR